MSSLSSFLNTGLSPPSPIAVWPQPPHLMGSKATSDVSPIQDISAYYPTRILYSPDLARRLDASLQQTVARAEAAILAKKGNINLLSSADVEEITAALVRASRPLGSYYEAEIQKRIEAIIEAVCKLDSPMHTLLGLPAPTELTCLGPHPIPRAPIRPGDAGRQHETLLIFADIILPRRREEDSLFNLPNYGIAVSLEVKVPEASRPPGRAGDLGGLHSRLERSLQVSPIVRIDNIEEAISNKAARSELLKRIATARICKNEHFFLVDGINYCVARLVEDDDGFTTLVSPFHPIVPANHANAQEPSFARVILATVIPSVINVAEVNKDLLAMESAAAPSDDLTANESRLQPEAASTRRPTRQTTRGTAGASAQSTGSGGTRTRTHGFDVGIDRCQIIFPDGSEIEAARPSDFAPDAPTQDALSPPSTSSPQKLHLRSRADHGLGTLPPREQEEGVTLAFTPLERRFSTDLPAEDEALPELTRSIHSTESTASAGTAPSGSAGATIAKSAATTVVLRWLICQGASGYIYGGHDESGNQVIVKVALPGFESNVTTEYRIGQRLRAFPADAVAPFLLLETSEHHALTVSPYMGESPADWDDLERDVRVALFVSLTRLHQLAHVQHNDVAPRNVVVDVNKSSSARWIDWSEAQVGHECRGASCDELQDAAGEMGLYGGEGLAEDVLARMAVEGLRW